MNHQAEIEGINRLQVKSESAIMGCNRLAILLDLQNDATKLIKNLVLGWINYMEFLVPSPFLLTVNV